MKLLSFRVENYRNLALAECNDVPNFVVICGGNGSGKSALLEALMTAKEHAGAYGNFTFDPRAVSADAQQAKISMRIAFSDQEREFVRLTYNQECPAEDEVVINIDKVGHGRAEKRSDPVRRLLGFYSREIGSPGFFDYITAHRQVQKMDLQTWDASFLSDEQAKNTLGGQQKFQRTKQYLAGLKMRDIQALQRIMTDGSVVGPDTIPDSLKEIRAFFDRFFAPMSFGDVILHQSPFGFTVNTPRGQIDIDDLSSGEKEILNTFIRFHQLNPNGAVILFDEADAHLHPDLERRYLAELRHYAKNNQLMITTHSPEMMIEAGSESLHVMLKEGVRRRNQFVRVSETAQLHEALSELMGSRGLVSFNQRIVFIEGEDASADRAIYERCYPPAQYNISFVPAGNSATVRRTAEQVNSLLSSSLGFQSYYSIVDGDLARAVPPPAGSQRLFELPVYHVENLLLDDDLVLLATRTMLGSKCPFLDVQAVRVALQNAVLDDGHIKPYTKALTDSKMATAAKEAYDSVFKRQAPSPIVVATFGEIEAEARSLMEQAINLGTWRAKCKGRDVLKTYCRDLGMSYEHFRNVMIEKLDTSPSALQEIMSKIIA